VRPLLVALLFFGLCLRGFLWYRERVRAEREATKEMVQLKPPAPGRSLEERAAAAQGTVLPPQAVLPMPRPARSEPLERAGAATSAAQYQCDGRTRCPEMHSCDEARWFLQHCPGTKMDGDGDGDPCEDQWCVR
jgi:hypothetical protein